MELLPCPFCNSIDVSYYKMVNEVDEQFYTNLHRKCETCKTSGDIKLWSSTSSPWISVKDRLPQDGVQILSYGVKDTNIHDDGLPFQTTLYRKNEFKTDHFCESSFVHNVTHWMPLPTPPRENWEVIEEPGKTFPEVFEEFKKGKRIRRKAWIYTIFYKNDEYERKITQKDLLATDWEIID